MKIMRVDSWFAGWPARAPGNTIAHGTCPCERRPALVLQPKGDPSMTWQTPAATDLRFGFEITMYVAAR
jgi:coenzyme PQQ precursor peptide PqqA